MNHPRFPLLICVAAAFALGGCASSAFDRQPARLSPEELARFTPPPNPKVPLADVIMWSQEKVAPAVMIKKLQETGTFYNLGAQQIVDLSKQGVDQSVIDHLATAQEKARQATLLTEIADRDAKAALDLERERSRHRMLPPLGYWGPPSRFGWNSPYYYDPFFRTWRPRW